MRKIKLLSVLVLLMLLSAGIGKITAQEPLPASPQPTDPVVAGTSERPRELTEAGYRDEVAHLYAQHPALKVVVDLEDPDGIDPSLLPSNVASLVGSNTKIVAFRETARLGSKRVPGLASPCRIGPLNIGCKDPDGSRDMTVSNKFWDGGQYVEQFCRVYALRYDWYPGCGGGQNCKGWEIEEQWAWWTRTDSSWTVCDGQMSTYIPGEDYCTENGATLNHGSTYFNPTWYGNQTGYWSISGFANNAYVPFPSGWSRTEGDICRYGQLKYSNARTYQYWSKD